MTETGARILIVDDDPDDAALTQRKLEPLGATVDFHEGASGAAEAIMSGEHDVVLLDVNMPGLSGLQILGSLDKSKIKGKVVLFSAIDETGLREMASAAGVEHLSKSASRADLLEHVKSLLPG